MTRRGLLFAATAPLERIERAEPHMGTLVRITVESRHPARAEAAIGKAFARIHQLDLRLSNYRADSEVNHFDPSHVSADLRPILDLSTKLTRETDGAFDPTQIALFDLWRAARKAGTVPSAAAIASALAAPRTRLDLGGIAKGYAADAAIAVLRAEGVSRALVAVSGDLAAGADRAWRISLDLVGATILLRHAAVSTSGDTEQYLEASGKRYSHIIDPRTGYGLTNNVVASVVANTGMVADALATVVCLMGVRAGTAIARRYRAKVYLR